VSKKSFDKLKISTLKNWSILGLETFSEYFQKQWLDGEFSNWALYHTNPGFSSTNNPIESFNSIIKRFITQRFKDNMLQSLEVFKDSLVNYDHKIFCNFPKIKKSSILRAQILIKDQINSLKEKRNFYEFSNKENKKFRIIINEFDLNNPSNTFCDCPYFQAHAFCKHIIMICLHKDLKLQGLESIAKFSLRKLHRSRKASKALCEE
jgi:hypothetical protein